MPITNRRHASLHPSCAQSVKNLIERLGDLSMNRVIEMKVTESGEIPRLVVTYEEPLPGELAEEEEVEEEVAEGS